MPSSDHDLPASSEGDRLPASIRRGQGLRLSVDVPPPEEATPPPTPPTTAPRRGKGMRLSVNTPPSTPPPASQRGHGLRLSIDSSLPINGAVTTTPPQEIPLADGPVFYRQAGDGPPLLLLHGWAASSRYWLGTLKDLGDVRHCYALDLPGFGRSPALSQPAQPDRLADVVIAFADALGLGQFDLNGHSFGASVAASLAGRYPDRVRRLVLTSFGLPPDLASRTLLGLAQPAASLALFKWQPWLNLSLPWLELWRPWQLALASTPPIPQLLAKWVMDDLPPTSEMVEEGIEDLTQMDFRAHLASLTSIGDPDITSMMRRILAPTLLVCGREDRIQPPTTLLAAQEVLPNSSAMILDRCGHLPMIERPALYHQLVRDFLQ